MLSETQRYELLRLLEQGEDVSPEWARVLFPPEKREYELVYHGKEREEDVIANTLTVPLQPVRTFGGNGADADQWQNMLIFGDNLQVMKSLLELKKAGKLCNADGTPGVRLVYIDPPFSTKQEFRGTQDQKAYQDKIAGARFVDFLRRRFVMIRELLADDGSLYVHLDQRKAHYAKVLLDEVFGEQNFRNELVWRNTNTHNKAETFGQIHQSVFLYTRSSRFLFCKTFRPRFRKYVESHYRHIGDDGEKFRYSDLTGDGERDGESGFKWRGYNPTARGRHWAIPGYVYDFVEDDLSELSLIEKLDYLLLHGWIQLSNKVGGQPQIRRPASVGQGNPIQDIWAYQPYTQGMYLDTTEAIDGDVTWAIGDAESAGYPTQKPEGLLARIIRSSSREGDLVLDGFAGSGTTCAVAEKLGRRWIGIDCGKLAIYTIQKRMLNLSKEIGNRGAALAPKAFTLFNAGLYDFSKLRELPWESWRFFALQLFQCRDQPHRVGGIALDGYLKGASVLVFNHMKENGVRIDGETIESLHQALGSRIGKRLFIIAPALTFDFQQDYIDWGNVRYYALRIPYSIIHELHQREFTALKQPADEMAVNDTVEAVGFDFIRTPELKFECAVAKRRGELFSEGVIRIKTFKSEAVVRVPARQKGNLESLSTVMLDYNYDVQRQVFELDAVFYAEAIRQQKWEVRFPLDNLGQKLMAVFIDIYGNEARVVIEAAEFAQPVKKKSPSVRPTKKATRKTKRKS